MTLKPQDQQKLTALKRFFVLDHAPPEDELGRIVRFTGELFGVKYAFLTLRKDGGKEQLEAAYGFDKDSIPRDATMFKRANGPSIPIAIADATLDPRFDENPLIRMDEPAHLYAGVPLKSSEGFTLGTLAIMDVADQELNGAGMAVLADIGAMVEPSLQFVQVKEEKERTASELAAAKEATRAKGAFLAKMSHEIRSALTSILGNAEFLADELEGDELQMAETIFKSSQRLLQNLNSVMDMERLESAGEAPPLESVSVAALVQDTVRAFERQAHVRNLTLICEGAERPTFAWADEAALVRVLDNLVSNSLKFTEKGGIRIRLSSHKDDVYIEIQDTGIGMDEAFLPRVFDDYERESSKASRKAASTGLGMSLTKRLVELMGGQISVTSRKGQGSVFRVVLRAAAAPLSDSARGDGVAIQASQPSA